MVKKKNLFPLASHLTEHGEFELLVPFGRNPDRGKIQELILCFFSGNFKAFIGKHHNDKKKEQNQCQEM